MQIRTLTETDLPALLALYPHLHSRDEPLPAEADVRAVWAEALANPRIRYYGAFDDAGALVGSCNLTLIPNLTRGARPFGVIENVVTHAAHRRRGLGRRLLAEALAQAWSERCYKVVLTTGRKDEATTRFYTAAGFDGSDKHAFVARPPAG